MTPPAEIAVWVSGRFRVLRFEGSASSNGQPGASKSYRYVCWDGDLECWIEWIDKTERNKDDGPVAL